MRSSNWCKNLAEILVSIWKASSSLWGGIHLQHPLSRACCAMPHLWHHSLSHVLTTQTATLKGEKEKCLNLSGELSPSFTGLEMIVYEYISSTLCQHFVSAPARQCKHRTEIGTFASRHKQSCLTLMFLKLYYRRLWCFLLTPWHWWELSMNIHWNKMLNMWTIHCSKWNKIAQICL